MSLADIDQLRIVLDPVGQAGVAIALMLIMFSVALGLSASDFRLLREKPVLFLGGVTTQIFGLPLLTFALINIVELPASIALGMIVVACCPGGAVSNLFTYVARGNVAYSVSLTATSSILAAVLTPVSILFWSGLFEPTATLLETIDVSPLVFLVQTTVLLVIPLLLGMMLAVRAPDLAEKLRRRTAQTGGFILLGVIVYGIAYFFPVLWPAIPLLFAVAAAHNAAAFLLGVIAGVILRGARAERRALMFEVGIQNSGLAIVILIAQLHGLGGAAAIAAVWGIWHLVAGGFMVLVLRIFDNREAAHES
jgi:BASS family bile acid:Na+ symporter